MKIQTEEMKEEALKQYRAYHAASNAEDFKRASDKFYELNALLPQGAITVEECFKATDDLYPPRPIGSGSFNSVSGCNG
jgi:hypothetical protein